MQRVVGAAILRDQRVLAARRTRPIALAGAWEFPGGKVEPGESLEKAAIRELEEELGCRIDVTGWLPGATRTAPGIELLVCTATLVSGDPTPVEHDSMRWLAADELDDVAWLPADLPHVEALRERGLHD